MAKSRLNQVIATVSGKKTQAEKSLTEAYHIFQKPELFSGLHRNYKKTREDGDDKPPEKKNPQHRVRDLYEKVEGDLTEMFDQVATQDYANCKACADVVVDGVTILSQAPVTYLLFLEKQITNLKNFVEKMPTRDAAEDWDYNAESDLHVTPLNRKNVTAKVQEPLVLHPATVEHPAQTQLITKDVLVGHWDERKMSGAVTKRDQDVLNERLRKLADAVKVAREEANQIEAPPQKVGAKLLDYVFGGVLKKNSVAAKSAT